MALTPASFTAPEGELTAEMFPGDVDLLGNISAWLTEATDRTDSEAAQQAWVYHRAWTRIYTRLVTTPAEYRVDARGEVRMLKEQIDHARDMAAYWLSEYEAATKSSVSSQSYAVIRSLR